MFFSVTTFPAGNPLKSKLHRKHELLHSDEWRADIKMSSFVVLIEKPTPKTSAEAPKATFFLQNVEIKDVTTSPESMTHTHTHTPASDLQNMKE